MMVSRIGFSIQKNSNSKYYQGKNTNQCVFALYNLLNYQKQRFLNSLSEISGPQVNKNQLIGSINLIQTMNYFEKFWPQNLFLLV